MYWITAGFSPVVLPASTRIKAENSVLGKDAAVKDDRENNSCSHNKCRPDGEIQ